MYERTPASVRMQAHRKIGSALERERANGTFVAASEVGSHFEREKIAALEVAGNPDAETALVTIGTIGDTAHELLDGDDDLLLVRVHAYRPFPAAELSAVLARASYVSIIDRAAAFGSLGPLGADVRALDLKHVKAARNFICGLGGVDVTPATLRWALKQTRASGKQGAGLVPMYVSEGV